jgi:hypothetical protein
LPLPLDPTTEVVCPGCGGSFRLQDTRATTTAELRLLGRFQVLGQVGMGSFGAVWRARDPELDRLVALKTLHPGLVSSADRERFHREARATPASSPSTRSPPSTARPRSSRTSSTA